MIIGSTKEDLSIEKRVALTPDAAKNIIGLGLNIYIEKNYADHLGIKDEDFKKTTIGMIPIGRLGEVTDLMGPFVFLASDASSLMTGSSILVDGGWTAR